MIEQQKRLPAHVRAAENMAKMKTFGTGINGQLTRDDLERHARVHFGFDAKRLEQWLNRKPGRWRAFRDVSSANRCMKGQQ